MIYEVLSTLKVKTKQGETILSPRQIINLNPSKADSWLAQGKIKPADSVAHTEPLEETLDSILWAARDSIIKNLDGRQYKATAEVRNVEDEIAKFYKETLSSQGSISEFQDACKRWERFYTKTENNN